MFVVFEGIDGSGKTTISNRVAKALKKSGARVTHLRAEGKLASPAAEAIREFGRDSKNLELSPRAEFLLYVARDVQMMEGPLTGAMGSSDVVLADRFRYTAEALARFGRHVPDAVTRPILDAALGAVSPDLVVLVDVDPALARARRKASKLGLEEKKAPSRKGLSGVGIQHRLRQGYLEMAAENPERWVVIENEQGLDEAVARVVALIEAARRGGARAAVQVARSEHVGTGISSERLAGAEEALQRFLGWVDARARTEPTVAAYFLRGLAGPGVDERRRALAETVPEHVLAGLAGLDDEVSWSLRGAYELTHPRAVAKTLSGPLLGTERASATRERLASAAPAEVASSLSRLADPASWQLRDRLYDLSPAGVVASLAGLGDARSWEVRRRFLASRAGMFPADYETARLVARSVSGLDDDEAWDLRLAARLAAPVAAIASVSRLASDRSFDFREQHLRFASKSVMMSLRGVDAPRAWAQRRAVVEDCKEAIDSVQGMDQDAAWELRETYADVWPSTVVKTLGGLAGTPRGQALLERQLLAYPSNLSLLKHASAVALGGYRDESAGDA